MFAINKISPTRSVGLPFLVAMTMAAGCGSDYSTKPIEQVVPVASVTVTSATSLAYIGFPEPLTVATLDAQGGVLTGRPVTWATSDASKATVSSSGVVTGLTAGYVTITATSEGRSGSRELLVFNIDVDSVAVNPTTASLARGGTQQLSVKMFSRTRLELPVRPVEWTTSDAAVATVSPSGLVTAMGAGTATITATRENRTARVVISVAP